MVVALVELLEQARAGDGLRPSWGNVEFGREDGVDHWGIIGNGGVVGYGSSHSYLFCLNAFIICGSHQLKLQVLFGFCVFLSYSYSKLLKPYAI